MKKLIIFGASDFAIEIFRYMKEEYEIIGFCVDDEYYVENMSILCGKKIFKLSEIDSLKNDIHILIAIGYKNMRARKEVYFKLKKTGFKFMNYIHASVIFEKDIKIGENNIILPGTVIGPGVNIGNNNIIHNKCIICHDVKLDSHNFLAAGVTLGGFSKVIDNNFIGFNSTVIQNIVIEKEILIGTMSLVNKNPKNYTCNHGIPAKEISNHKDEGIKI